MLITLPCAGDRGVVMRREEWRARMSRENVSESFFFDAFLCELFSLLLLRWQLAMLGQLLRLLGVKRVMLIVQSEKE